MARNLITRPAKLQRYGRIVGEPVLKAWARGGTDHRVDVGLSGGRIVHIHRDGSIEPSDIRWGEHPCTCLPAPFDEPCEGCKRNSQ